MPWLPRRARAEEPERAVGRSSDTLALDLQVAVLTTRVRHLMQDLADARDEIAKLRADSHAVGPSWAPAPRVDAIGVHVCCADAYGRVCVYCLPTLQAVTS